MSLTRNGRGIAAICVGMCIFVGNDTLVKLAAEEGLPTVQIIVMRGVVACSLFFLGIIALSLHTGARATLTHPLVILRSSIDALVTLAFITALPLMPIADLTAISMVSPILITILSALLLRESVGWRRWLAVAAGFAGMLRVVRPSAGGFQLAGLLGLASACGVAFREIVTRRLPPTLPSVFVALATTLTTTVIAVVLTPFWPAWQMPSPRAIGYLLGAAVLLVAGTTLVILAFRDVDVSAVSPFRFTSVAWAMLAGLLVFGNVPAPLALAGVVLIVASGTYTAHRERVRKVARVGSPTRR
jgi:drug/metabolite transporter (DMT)-like permease